MTSIRATPKFTQRAKKAMTSEALQGLIDELALHPEKGVVIPGAGGIRKLRWETGKNNKGKSGGVRVLYYYEKQTVLILLITLFRKSDKENVDESEKNLLRKMLPELLGRYHNESIR